MTQFAADHTMLTLLGIAFVFAAGWSVYVLVRSIWLDEYGRPKE